MTDPIPAHYSQQLVRDLIAGQASEGGNLDFKSTMHFGPTKSEKAKILKSIMAFANTRDGGHILIGAREDGGRFVLENINEDQANSFDPTEIGTFSKNYCSPLPSVSRTILEHDGKTLLMLKIAEFGTEPIVCLKSCHDSDNKLIIRAGGIYVRTTDARSVEIESGEQMRSLLNLAVLKRGDQLLHQIGRLVGTPAPTTEKGLDAGYQEELQTAYSRFDELEVTTPWWAVEIFPIPHNVERFETTSNLREIRQTATVNLRGWDFPHVDPQNDLPFDSGIESFTHWEQFHEAHRFYKSGLFAFRRKFHEEADEYYRGTVSYVQAIFTLTEFFTFAKRYTESLPGEIPHLVVRITVTNLSDHPLRFDPGNFGHTYRTAAKEFHNEYKLTTEELKSSHVELAAKSAKQLFDLYGRDLSLDVIGEWQKQILPS